MQFERLQHEDEPIVAIRFSLEEAILLHKLCGNVSGSDQGLNRYELELSNRDAPNLRAKLTTKVYDYLTNYLAGGVE